MKKKRLIDANDLIRKHGRDITNWDNPCAVYISSIENAPTVDTEEVVHGRWIQKEFWPDGGTWRCSECGRQIMFLNGTPITEKATDVGYQ